MASISDGNVLASVLPVLDAAQFARLFGPALALTFHAPDYPDEDGWPVRRAVLAPPAEPAPPVMLALRTDQMRGVEAARLERSQRRTAKLIRETTAEHTQNISDEVLVESINKYEKSARSHGLTNERAMARYIWLMHGSNGKFIQMSGVVQLLSSGLGTPNDRLNLFAEAMADAFASGTKT